MVSHDHYSYPPQKSYQPSYHPAPSYPAARGPPPAPRQQQRAAPDVGWDSTAVGGYSNGGHIQYYPSPAPTYHDSFNRRPRDAYRDPLPPPRDEYGRSGPPPAARWSNSYAPEPYYPPAPPRSPPRRRSAERCPPSHAAHSSPPRAMGRAYRDLDVSPEAVKVKYTFKPSPAPQPQPPPPPPPRIYDYGVLSTSIIYCCRPINYHAFMALQPSNYPHLELHFVPTLAELEWAISEAAFAHSGAMRVRRKCFVTPGGGSDEYVARVRKEMEGVPLYWRQAITVEVLEEELEKDEVFVTNKDPDLQPVSASNDSQDRFETVESDKSARKRRTVALAPVAEKAELQAIERQETDDPSSTVLALEEAAAGMDREEREIVDSAASSKAKSSGGQHEDGSTASPAWSRKRSRRESEGSSKQSSRRDSGEGAEQAHKAAKALKYACKKPRRICNDWELKNGVPIDEATREADDEPILGERHRGIWDLYGEPLHNIPPHIQVLMARALRDAAQPTSDHSEAFQQLTQAAPWFLALLEPLKKKPDTVLPVAQTNSTTTDDAEAWAQDPLPPQLSGSGLDVGDLSF